MSANAFCISPSPFEKEMLMMRRRSLITQTVQVQHLFVYEPGVAVSGNVDNLYDLSFLFFFRTEGIISILFYDFVGFFPLAKLQEIGSDAIIIQRLQTVEEKTRYVLAFLILPHR